MPGHSYLHLPVAVHHSFSEHTASAHPAIIHCLLGYPQVSSVWSSVNGLQVAVGLHAFNAPLNAESTLLVTSKGDVGHDLSMCVDPHIPRLELFSDACGLFVVASPHGRTKSSLSLVSSLDDIGLIRPLQQRKHGAWYVLAKLITAHFIRIQQGEILTKLFLRHDCRVLWWVIDDCGGEEEALLVGQWLGSARRDLEPSLLDVS